MSSCGDPRKGRRGRRFCDKKVWWTKTQTGNADFAVNLKEDPKGNTAVWCDATGTLRSRRITDERPLMRHERQMMPHVATCKPPPRRTAPPPRPPRPPRPRPAAGEFYARLDVPTTATPDDIKRAYRRLARQLHPDANPGDEAAAERFKGVTEAYTTLSDPAKRATYDLTGRAPRPGR
ncbi:J domain-containing protein [Streptosporangium lutulentum]